MPPRAAKKYIVCNPRGIAKSVHIIKRGAQRWYEGDAYDPPPGADLDRLLRGGFIKEVRRSG